MKPVNLTEEELDRDYIKKSVWRYQFDETVKAKEEVARLKKVEAEYAGYRKAVEQIGIAIKPKKK